MGATRTLRGVNRLRVGLDLRSGGWLGGLYYLQNLALAIRALPEAEQPQLIGFATAAGGAGDELAPLLQIERFEGGIGRRANARRMFPPRHGITPSSIESALRLNPVDILFPSFGIPPRTPSRTGPARLPWVTDLQHFSLPEYFSRSERRRRTSYFSRLARHARTIVVSSEHTRRGFEQHFPAALGKVRVLRFRTVAIEDWLEGDMEVICRRYGLRPGFLFIPNQFWAHKGHATAFAALDHLGGSDQDLVCTGSTEDYRQPTYFDELIAALDRSKHRGRVKILGVVPRDDYIQLLRAAAVVVQPSHFEGWSSIVEDARALGKRLVLSDLDVHREQRPPGAHLFPPGDAAALASAVAAALENPDRDQRDAVDEHRRLVQGYARDFIAIAREAVARG
jgi:hypothetical protein